jgi:hypothetical protein
MKLSDFLAELYQIESLKALYLQNREKAEPPLKPLSEFAEPALYSVPTYAFHLMLQPMDGR